MFERPQTGERAILLHPVFGNAAQAVDLVEFTELAVSAGADVLATETAPRSRPEARYLVGAGKVDELARRVAELDAELVLVSHSLTPSQERNLERALKCRVLDRGGLILDIFAQRARSFEGKLQVELAQLRHLSTRLIRGWTHLERQKGGIGLRGPGETQLETDRRLVRQRIRQLQARLDKVDRQRELGRRNRLRNEIPTVALVGYTNAGKSTLFNRLTEASVYAADQLFATLDPTLRRLELDDRCPVVIADTVGFVSDLPHELIAAFKATLTETREATLILHVVDASDPDRQLRIEQVNTVLRDIGARDVPQIRVYNKSDLLDYPAPVLVDASDSSAAVRVSALTGNGLDALRETLLQRFSAERVSGEIRLDVAQGRARAALFDLGAVVSERIEDNGDSVLEVNLAEREFSQFCRDMGFEEGMLPLAATRWRSRVSRGSPS